MKYSIFDSLLEAVFAINKDQKIVYCNETAGVLLDNSVRKLMKMTLPEAITFIPNSPEFYKNLANITDPSPYEELNFETSTGKAGKLQVTVQPDTESDPQNPCWLVFFRDVTLEETLQKKYRSQLEQKEEVILDLQKARAQLEEYSKNLEKMVEERTAEIRQLNRWMSALLDSLGQGFFIFDKDCKILPVTSKACESTLETDPKGKFVYDIFKIKPEKVDGFKKWVMTVFGEMLPFQDLAPLGPDRYQHSKDREISIQYHPIRTPEGKIDGVVVVSTDITDLVQAQKEAERDRNYAKMIVNLVKNKKMAQSFVRESQNILAELKTYIQRPNPDTEEAFRLLHTLKGGAATLGVAELAEECHQAENKVSLIKEPGSDAAALWKQIATHVVTANEQFANFIKNQMAILGIDVTRTERYVEIPASKLVSWSQNALCPVVTTSGNSGSPLAHDILENWALQPLQEEFKSFDPMIQSTAENLGKKALPLTFSGDPLRVWPEAYSELMASLVHAFRNAVDHGFESPEDRVMLGKPEAGKIEVHFVKESPHKFRVEIRDDGAGINPRKIREKLASQGKPHEHETDEQVIQHVFDSQFSTRQEITLVSGRGVGMDAIKEAVKALGGDVRVLSTLGKGSTVVLELPWKKAASQPLKKTA